MAILMLSSQPVLAGSLADQRKSAEAEKNKIESNMSTTQSKVNQTKNNVSSVQAEIQALDSQINAASYELEQLNNEIGILQGEIAKTREELEIAKAELEKNKELFAKRLRVMYMANDTGYLGVILNSNGVEELIGNAKMITSIADQDRELVDTIKKQVKEIEEKQALLEKQEAELRSKQATVESKKANLEAANAKKMSYMDSLIGDLTAYEAEYNEMLNQSAQLESKIVSLQNQMDEQARKEAEAARRAAEEARRQAEATKQKSQSTAARSSAASSSSAVVNAAAEPIRREVSGSMYWPVPGNSRISSPYGYRIHPVLKYKKMHTGIDIPASSGTPIVAAKGGVVIASSFMSGYGNCVMVDHGGMVTVYAHCSSRAVSVGQRVSGGQTIAYVGSTGMSTGPHLHFEVRLNGKTTNPMNYL